MQQVLHESCFRWIGIGGFLIVDAKKEVGDKIDAGIKSEGEEETGNNTSKGKATLGRTPNHLTLR